MPYIRSTGRTGAQAPLQADTSSSAAQHRAAAAAQAAALAAREAEDEEPMNRYIYPLPQSCGSAGDTDVLTAALGSVQETLCRQNQLLIDLMAAVNALTAAVLGRN